MKLILENFKCYSNTTEINFIDNGLIYLNGKSGAGKSTIFKAISFILYGKEQKISHYKFNKKKTTVQLITNNIHIIRTRLPNTLKCIQNDITYFDEAAQSIINKIFGYYSNFNLTSYIAQKNIENFLQLSKDQKTAFLQKLAIEEYPIEVLKEKIKNELKIVKNDLLNCTSKLNALKNLENKYTVQIQPIFDTTKFKSIKLDIILNGSTINESILNETINSFKKELDNYTDIYLKYEKYISELNIYNNLIQELENKLNLLNISDKLKSKSKNELQQIIKNYNEFIKSKNDLEKYNQLIQEITNEQHIYQSKLNLINKDNTINISQENLYKVKFILEKYKCNTLNLMINLNLKNKEKFNLLQKEIDQLETQIKNSNKKIYRCPCCNENLIINSSNSLEKVNNENKFVEIKNQNDITKELNKLKNEKLQLEIFFNDYLSIDKKINTDLQLNDINKILENIKNKDILEDKLKQLKLKLDNTIKLKANLNENKSESENEINIEVCNTLYMYKCDIEKYKINITNLEKSYKYGKDITKEKLNDLKKINQELNELNNLYKNYVFENNQYLLFLEYKKEIEDISKNESLLLKKKYNYEEFYSKVLLSESKTLEYIIDTINLILEEYISIFFEDELSVFLTNTTVLSNGEKKYCIDVEILDKDGNEIGIDNLSGGEYDRCALALFLSFNRLSNSPILLLDECLSSLHYESIETIIECIKSTLTNKQVIVTLHQGNHGLFDEIINIEEMNK
jgi:DNA repair exonuclease SbcCD ATPase subunit